MTDASSNRALRIEELPAKVVEASGQSFARVGFLLPYRRVGAGSFLALRYRSNRMTDLIVSMQLSDQRVRWRLRDAGPDAWRRVCLALGPRYSVEPTKAVTIRLELSASGAGSHTTSRDRPAPATNPWWVELDDFELLDEPGDEANRLLALRRRFEREARARAQIDAALTLGDLTASQRGYVAGDPVVLTAEVLSRSRKPLPVPPDWPDAPAEPRPKHPLFTEQRWIEPLDDPARRTNFGTAGRAGARFAAGGQIRYNAGPMIRADDAIRIEKRFGYLEPGRYRVFLQRKDRSSTEVLEERSLDIEVIPLSRGE